MLKLKFKEGVVLHPYSLSYEMSRGLSLALATAPDLFDDILVVTSQCDGNHSAISLHYFGAAWDIRYIGVREGGISNFEQNEVEALRIQKRDAAVWVHNLKNHLGPYWDVMLESTHIHMEYDPR